jgi:hypothetical protein
MGSDIRRKYHNVIGKLRLRESNTSLKNYSNPLSRTRLRFGIGYHPRLSKVLEFMRWMAPNVLFGRTNLQVKKGVYVWQIDY